MPNLINEVDRIVNNMQRGWPDGTHELHREIPVLLARIKELEDALVPFARVWLAETSVGGVPMNSEYVVQVYLRNCKTAYEQLTTENSVKPKEDNFFSLPAEG
jgi:hypothetical protein